jgi:small GTP-binding protein
VEQSKNFLLLLMRKRTSGEKLSEPIPFDGHKIVLLGIENAGKTSIIKTLTHEFDEIAKLKPTVSVERTFMEILGKKLYLWDFGGQESYRDKYLTQPERYFDQISHVFYVMDIQDVNMLGSNIMYFQGVYRRLKSFSPNAKFILLFHKLDPDLKVPLISKNMVKEFLEAVPESQDINYCYTSIFNPRSIVQAFTSMLFGKQDLNENLSKILASFCQNFNLKFASLVTENFLELGYYANQDFIEKNSAMIDKIFRHFYLNFKSWLDPKTPVFTDRIEGNVELTSHLFILDTKQLRVPFYLVIGYDETKSVPLGTLKKEISQLDENLIKILSALDLKAIFEESLKVK